MGGEINSVTKDWSASKLKCAYVFPDKYEVGMSNVALHLFYEMINGYTEHVLERSFAPDNDMIDLLKRENIPLFSLENKKPLNEFDAIAFSFSTEVSFTNALLMLDLAKIPLFSKERIDLESPLIFAGGGGVVNPLPMQRFIDFFVIGDGEDLFEWVLDVIYDLKYNKSKNKLEILEELSNNNNIYVPLFYSGQKIKKHIFKNFDKKHYPVKPIVPFIKIVHNRFSLELMKGCPRQCLFCQASYLNSPVRLKDKDKLYEQGVKVLENTGYEELSLASLSSSDYPYLYQLANDLHKYADKNKVKLSLPSLRIDSYSEGASLMVNKVRESGVTLAPEAGTQRLRDVIRKKISEEDIFNAIKCASKWSKKGIKLYFMIGLPTETMKDIEGIVDLVYKLQAAIKPKRNKIIVNVSNFVPKPHTPFQWCGQDSKDDINKKLDYLKKSLRNKQIELRWTDADLSILEGVLSRGDEEVGELIYRAYKNGASFDAWYEVFDFSKWEQAAESLNLDLNKYLVEHSVEDDLPWFFIEAAISHDRLRKDCITAFS